MKSISQQTALAVSIATILVGGCFDGDQNKKEIAADTPTKTMESGDSRRRQNVEVPAAPQANAVNIANQTAVVADTVVLVQPAQPEPNPVAEGKWSSAAIQKNPYGFIQDQIGDCDKLKAKIESQRIALTRMGKQSARTIEESDGTVTRYTAFLNKAKEEYKRAESENSWPVSINGFKLDEEQLSDRISDALERIELARKDKTAAEAVAKKVEMRQRALKAKARELSSLRLKLVQQAEQVKMNAELAEIGDLSSVLGALQDMTLEVDNPSEMLLEEMTAEDPDAKKKSAVRAFLDN